MSHCSKNHHFAPSLFPAWRPVVGNPAYEVSSDGHVWSKRSHRILSPGLSGTGYRTVQIDGRSRYLHRLVAQSWLGIWPPDWVVNHRDGNKLNNDVRNLEWTTYSENLRHAWATGLRANGRRTRKRRGGAA